MTPALTVVVPTCDRAGRLGGLVDALAALEAPPGGIEVVFVDDASTDHSATVLEEATQRWALHATVVHNQRRLGPAATRNRGWRMARAPNVAFLDDDCRPERGWASALHRALSSADIVQGRTVPASGSRRGPFSHTVRIEGLTQRYETCNIAYRRSLLNEVGGFDEGFPLAYGEDVDLGWRAVATGATVAFAGDATVRHDVEPSSIRARFRRAPRVGAMATVVRRHPGYRQHLHGGVFTDRSHLWALVAAAGMGAATLSRRPTLALLAAGYVGHRLGTAPLWQRWKSPVTVPIALAVDLREVGALARASLRERTLVL